ncbi:MAG: PEP-CTERM sorting domain-containing protein [Azonexus sp.]|nr:PEP-CTERM sorting domain-containing protein [Azonexus sp.]
MNNLTRIALATALLGSAGMAQAQLNASTASSAFSGSASASATASSVASASGTNNNVAIATVGVGQFDSSTGVLVGANIQLNSERLQSISGTGSKNNGPGRDANGSGSSTAAFSASGASSTFATPATLAGSGCSLAMGPTGAISCNWGPTTSAAVATNATAAVSTSNLNDYVGNGSTSVALSLPSLQATSTLSRTQGQASSSTSTYTVSWSGNLQASYDYLLHAAPSFANSSTLSSLTLDFGTVAQGASISPLSFSLFNLAGANRAGLDLDSVSGSGNTGKLTTNLAGFIDLAQGGSSSYDAWLDTTSTGNFSSHYLLNLSDADIGASATRKAYQLELNLVGNVAAVPEPESYAMLLAGLGMIGVIARRRREFTR